MLKRLERNEIQVADSVQPVYEIRVQGTVNAQYWNQWFDSITVAVDERHDETTIIAPVTDQAAMYGVLARLRDMAIPLISVQQIIPTPRSSLVQIKSGRFSWLFLLVYLLIVGGLSGFTVFLSKEVHTALALTILFVGSGGLAYAFFVESAWRGWAVPTGIALIGAISSLIVYITTARLMPVSLVLGMLSIIIGGILLFAYYRFTPKNRGR